MVWRRILTKDESTKNVTVYISKCRKMSCDHQLYMKQKCVFNDVVLLLYDVTLHLKLISYSCSRVFM